MKMFGLTIAFLFCLVLSGFSCEVPTRPVYASVWVLDGKIKAEITNNILYWRDKVLGEGAVTTAALPEELHRKAENYINENFIIRIDGNQLTGKIRKYRYMQNPWTNKKYADVRFLMEYPVDMTSSRELKIKSVFFYKEHSLHKEEHEHHPCPVHDYGLIKHEFVTYLKIKTGKGLKVELPVEKPGVAVDVNQYRQTFFQRQCEFFKNGLGVLIYVSAFCLFLLAWFLFPVSLKDSVKYLAMLAASVLAGMISENYLLKFPDMFLPYLFGLSGTMYVCIINYVKPGAGKTSVYMGAIGIFWGMLFSNRLVTFCMYDRPGMVALISHLLGVVTVSALVLLAENRIVVIFKKYLYKKSESMAEKKFIDNMKFLSMIILVISGILMFQLVKYRVWG